MVLARVTLFDCVNGPLHDRASSELESLDHQVASFARVFTNSEWPKGRFPSERPRILEGSLQSESFDHQVA